MAVASFDELITGYDFNKTSCKIQVLFPIPTLMHVRTIERSSRAPEYLFSHPRSQQA